jgi:hypothetical protein
MLKVLTQHDHVKAVWVKFDSEILQCFFYFCTVLRLNNFQGIKSGKIKTIYVRLVLS